MEFRTSTSCFIFSFLHHFHYGMSHIPTFLVTFENKAHPTRMWRCFVTYLLSWSSSAPLPCSVKHTILSVIDGLVWFIKLGKFCTIPNDQTELVPSPLTVECCTLIVPESSWCLRGHFCPLRLCVEPLCSACVQSCRLPQMIVSESRSHFKSFIKRSCCFFLNKLTHLSRIGQIHFDRHSLTTYSTYLGMKR